MTNEYLYDEAVKLALMLDARQTGRTKSKVNSGITSGGAIWVSGVYPNIDEFELESVCFQALLEEGMDYTHDANLAIMQMIEKCDGPQKVKRRVIDLIFQLPYEDIPLHINDPVKLYREILNWRLDVV